MTTPDDFSSYLADLLEGTYDCVDRIVLKGYFPYGQQGGGMRTWWRNLCGSDQGLCEDGLRRFAGDFSRRLQADAKKTTFHSCAAPSRSKSPSNWPASIVPPTPTSRGCFWFSSAKAQPWCGSRERAPGGGLVHPPRKGAQAGVGRSGQTKTRTTAQEHSSVGSTLRKPAKRTGSDLRNARFGGMNGALA